MTISVAHWDTLITFLRFSVQGEDIIERTNGKCCFVHFSHIADHYVT